MKKILVWCLLLTSAVVLPSYAAPQPLDKIVVVINSDVITESQLQKQMKLIKQQIPPNAPMPDNATFRKQVLDQLINKQLLFMLAKRNKLQITDTQLNTALASIAARNNLSLNQLQSAVQKQGMNYNDFRQQIREQMLIQQVEEQAVGPS